MLALLLIVGLIGTVSIAHGDHHSHGESHRCIHDTPAIQRMMGGNGQDITAPQKYAKPNEHKLGAQAVAPIRFSISPLDLYNSQRYCSSVGQTMTNLQGGSVTCTADDILTDAKRAALINNIWPAIKARLQAIFSVNQVVGNLVVPAGACGSSFTVPANSTSPGWANTDMAIYVAGAPTTGSTMAWAAYCSLDQNHRPIAGRVNFGPKYLVWDAVNPANNNKIITAATHEILHSMGFSNSYMTNFVAAMRGTSTRRAKTVNLFKGTNALAQARTYYNCPTLDGVELEDEGSSGSALSHWDRRNNKDDIMAPVVDKGYITPLTLAYFQDLGIYTIATAQAGKPTWGKNAGCSFFSSFCNTSAAGLGTMWNLDQTGSTQYCTYDQDAIGVVQLSTYSAALPAYFQWFTTPTKGGPEFVDKCPYVQGYSNRFCTDGTQASDAVFGNFFGTGGRCITTNNLIKSGYSSSSTNKPRCLKVRCPSQGARVELQVYSTTTWLQCPSTGAAGQINPPTGYTGVISCPSAASICTPDLWV